MIKPSKGTLIPQNRKEKQKKKKRKHYALAGIDGNARLFGKILPEDGDFFKNQQGLVLSLPDRHAYLAFLFGFIGT